MLLGQLASRIDHLGLYPESELEPLLRGIVGQRLDAVGQLGAVGLPVAQPLFGVVARILVAKPSVVQHKHLQPYLGGIVNHLPDDFLVKVEVGSFPAV